MNKINKKMLIATAMIMLAGCSTVPDERGGSPAGTRGDDIPLKDGGIGLSGDSEMSPIEYRISGKKDYFVLTHQDKSNPLPQIEIKNFFVSNTSVHDALRVLLSGTGINLSMSHGEASKIGLYMSHNKGKLTDIVEQISDTANLFYRYDNNTLTFTDSENFVFKIPPMMSDVGVESIVSTLTALGAENTSIDSHFNTVSFQAQKKQLKGIKDYLENINESGSVIVYDTWIWEVSLNKTNRAGVRWEELDFTKSKLGLSLTGGGVADRATSNDLIGGISYVTDTLSLTTLVSFLKKHGTLATLSHPRISLLSGGEAKFEVGEEVEYVSELTSTVSTSGDTTQSSAETETLSTGLKMTLQGNYEENSVFSRIELEVSDLLRFNEFVAYGTVLSLPETVIRKVSTDTRINPGEYFILGGVNMSRRQNDDSGVPGPWGEKGFSMPLSKDKSTQKSELVIVMRPRVVVFQQEDAPRVKESKK